MNAHVTLRSLGLPLAFIFAPACDDATSTTPEMSGLSEASDLRTVPADDLDPASTLIVDVRAREAYDAGHIDGAVWLDAGQLRAEVDGVEGQVADASTSEAAFREAGLQPNAPIVVVGAENDTTPARVAWTLRYYGHLGWVGLLDGGMTSYRGATVTTPTAADSDYTLPELRSDLRVDKGWMLEHLADPDVAIFDVRTSDEFNAGHIPGAVHVNWVTNLSEDGLFRPGPEVAMNHGEPTEPTLVVYCRTGSRAAVSWALLRAAGYDDVRLYDGSWAEWGSDPQTPKE